MKKKKNSFFFFYSPQKNDIPLKSTDNEVGSQRKNVFLFNPFENENNAAKIKNSKNKICIWVQNEPNFIEITFRNPFIFNLTINSVQFLIENLENNNNNNDNKQIIIPCLTPFELSPLILEPKASKVIACRVQLPKIGKYLFKGEYLFFFFFDEFLLYLFLLFFLIVFVGFNYYFFL